MKKVRFLEDCEIEVYEHVDENMDLVESSIELFINGTVVEFDVLDHPIHIIDGEWEPDPDLVNVQFGDGSVTFGLSILWFEEC